MPAPCQAAPRQAATAILMRPTTRLHPFEVLLLKRSANVAFAGGVWVFPGGAIDPEDFLDGGSTESLDQEQMLPVAIRAAVRETQEESGVDIGAHDFAFYSHWTTPEQYKKRFATWFFLAEVATHHQVTVDNSEITHHQWRAPAEIIAQFERGDIDLMPPTYLSLLELNRCGSIDEALAFAKSRKVPYFLPKFHKREQQMVFLYEGDSGYAANIVDMAGERHRLERSGNCYQYLNTLND